MKPKKICLIHTTHTDVGFTGTQEEVEFQHYDFLLQAVAALESGRSKEFFWQCENAWQIDNFYEHADEAEKKQLEKWIRQGRIGLAGTYLNMTELADAETLSYWVKQARAYASSIGVESHSAISCDVNGYSWALPDILSENGYRYFLGSIHTHHGMYPLFGCPSCFRWKGPKGGTIIAFISEHYNLGNELGFCPHSMLSYSIQDRYSKALATSMFHSDAETTEKEELEVALYRIQRYIEGLNDNGYPFDCVPILVSGAYTDNSAPNAGICERADKLNRLLGGKVCIELSLLDQFFAELEQSGVEIPILSGDFPDWWASGIGTLPNSVRMYRQAQRNMRLVRKLNCTDAGSDGRLYKQAMKNAVLFAEHTWDYCATVFNPWSMMNKLVEQKNAAYAANFHSTSMQLLLSARRALGDRELRPGRSHSWAVINPNSFDMCCPISLPVEAWEYAAGCRFFPDEYELRNDETGEIVLSQLRSTPRGVSFDALLQLKEKSRINVSLARKTASGSLIDHRTTISTDRVRDIAGDKCAAVPSDVVTPYFEVKIRREDGIMSIVDRQTGNELLDGDGFGLFTAIRDITHIPDDSGVNRKLTRRAMGRNLVAFATERKKAKLFNAVISENGAVYITLELTYRLEGLKRYIVRLRIYKQYPLLSADIIAGAEGGLEPENLYIALPFVAQGDTYAGKAGYMMRPGIDQLPGTCQSHFAVQDGIIRQNKEKDVLIMMNDIPLVLFGLPEAEKVKLCTDDRKFSINARSLFALAANNYWETNFPCNIAGDYQFTISIMLSKRGQPLRQLEKMKAFSEGMIVLRK